MSPADERRELRARRQERCPGCGPEPVEPEPGLPPRGLCDPCERARSRGVPCCERCGATLVLQFQRQRYCARCPGRGKLCVIVVTPDGAHERESWHPIDKVQRFAQRAGIKDALAVVVTASGRYWRTGRIPEPRGR